MQQGCGLQARCWWQCAGHSACLSSCGSLHVSQHANLGLCRSQRTQCQRAAGRGHNTLANLSNPPSKHTPIFAQHERFSNSRLLSRGILRDRRGRHQFTREKTKTQQASSEQVHSTR